MTGHHIYTRSWFEYGSRSKNPGTFTVELSDGLFGSDAGDIIYHKLNPVLAGTQPSIAGYDLENSLLRVFHPTADSTFVGRSYFVNDAITKRGVVQYSFGLVFSREANERFLRYPKRAFELSAVEPYDEFVKRVSEESPLTYSAAYDPRPADYQEATVFSREDWAEMGLTQDVFAKFFVSLGKAITSQKNEKVAVLLPEGKNGEQIIMAVLTLFPPWLLTKFGAVSRWTGALEGGQAASVSGMQLVFYSGEKPPSDTMAAVIDLTGAARHKNIEDLTPEQQELAVWYWENIEKPEAIKTMTDYMQDKYKNLMDKMPFSVFAHCFYLWATFHVTGYDTSRLNFGIAARAINSLVSAFGKNMDMFFTNRPMLTGLFRVFIDEMAIATTSQISLETVRSICILANGDFSADQIFARDLVKPLYTKLFQHNEWAKIEPVMQYYTKMLNDGASEEKVAEAIELFELILQAHNKKSADDAAAVLSNYANASVAAMFADGTNRVDEYKKIALLLKAAKRQMSLDIASWENVSRNETASRVFYLLEKFNREHIANINPPGKKQLENILNGIQNLQPGEKTNVLGSLLNLYWQSDALKDTAQMRKYVQYLHENRKLHLYLSHNIGTDDIRGIFTAEIDRSLDTREFISDDEKIDEILKWFTILRTDCGFPDSDAIFLHLGEKLAVLGGIDTICKALSPKTVKTLAEIFTNLGAHENAEILLDIVKFDEAAGSKGEFSRIYRGWNVEYAYFLMRMEFWFNNSTTVSAEWALSRAVYETEFSGAPHGCADMYLNYRGLARGHKEDLINLYEAMHIVDDNHYPSNLSDEIFKSLKSKAFQIINELEDRDSYETLFATAAKFKSYAGRLSGNTRMPLVGREISLRIKNTYTSSKPPHDVLKKFNPNERESISFSGNSSMTGDVLSLALVGAFFICVVALLILLFAGGFGLPGALLALPLPLLIGMVVSLLITLVLTFMQIFRPEY